MSLRELESVFDQATPQDVIAGMRWYDEAHRFARHLASKYGVSLDVAAGVIAALSPRSKWERNIQDAENVIAAYVRGKDPMEVPCGTFNHNKERAVEILSAGTRHGILSGEKVCAFADNIENPRTDTVVVDSHAYNAWLGERAIIGEHGIRITPKRYRETAEGYRQLANQVGIAPNQAQAIVWLAWKRMYNA
jgi:hypothetical protein